MTKITKITDNTVPHFERVSRAHCMYREEMLRTIYELWFTIEATLSQSEIVDAWQSLQRFEGGEDPLGDWPRTAYDDVDGVSDAGLAFLKLKKLLKMARPDAGLRG